MDRHDSDWRKASYSNGQGDCVEVSTDACVILVRDTKDRAGAVLTFGPGAWRRFAARIKDVRKV
jgi:hypothetical protein